METMTGEMVRWLTHIGAMNGPMVKWFGVFNSEEIRGGMFTYYIYIYKHIRTELLIERFAVK